MLKVLLTIVPALCAAVCLCSAAGHIQPPRTGQSAEYTGAKPHTTPPPVMPCEIYAEFTVSDTHIRPGEKITCTNTSSGATRYQWSVDGIPVASTTNFSPVFDTPGSHVVELIVQKDIDCLDIAYAIIHVASCPGNQTLTWYFGNHSGLRFTTTPPTVLADGAMNTREGCAAIGDGAGALLFYTDGVSVWNRLHGIMPGGNRTLAGSSSSTQSALIVPKPGDPTLYYVFTTDAAGDGGNQGCSYAVVDMTGDNGKGIVSQPSVQLQSNVSEKLTAVSHANGRDVWIIVRGTLDDNIYTFLVTDSGIRPPVTTTLGITYTHNIESVGAMKVAPTGNVLALASFQQNRVEVYPFDRTTGMVSDAGSFVLTDLENCYGIEFSPDGTLLYAGTFGSPSGVTQFDLTAGTPAAVQASAVFLPSAGHRSVGSLQLGPDGRIYITREDAKVLDVIARPQLRGRSCGYIDSAIVLEHPATLGLPGFVQDLVTQERVRITGPTNVCLSSTVGYTNERCATGDCTWQHRGKATATIDGNGAILHFTSPGVDTLTLLYSEACGAMTDTLFITTTPAPVVSLGEDRILCSTATVTLDAGGGFSRYEWQDGSTERLYTADRPGLYRVTVTDKTGCTATDTIRIFADTAILPDLGPDTAVCSGGTLVLQAPDGFTGYRWQDGSTGRTLTVYTPGLYAIEARNGCGTLVYDTILVRPAASPLRTSGDTAVCSNSPVQLSVTGAVTYQWTPAGSLDDPSSAMPTAFPDTTTTYTVTGTDDKGCTYTTTVTVSVFDASRFVLSLPDTTAAPGATLALPLYVTAPAASLPMYIGRLSLSLRYRSSFLKVQSVSNGAYTIIPGNDETLHLVLRDVLLTNTHTRLATVTGTVYLGDTSMTTLHLHDLVLNDCPLSTARSGSLTPDSVCAIGIRPIRPLGDVTLHIDVSPNPADDYPGITVTTAEEGEHRLALYNTAGQLVWSSSFRHRGARDSHTLYPALGHMAAGLYQVVVTAPSQAQTTLLSVVR